MNEAQLKSDRKQRRVCAVGASGLKYNPPALSISLPILIFKERWGEELSQDTIIDIGGRAERLEWHMIKLKDITTKKSGGHFVQLIFIFIG